MAGSSKDELVQLVKRISTYLALKVSSIFSLSINEQSSPSIWALAGLAAAVLFTWKLLRTPNGRGMRPPKRQNAAGASATNAQSNATTLASADCSSLENFEAKNTVAEFVRHSRPTLGQIVRQKLGEGRKVTCQLVGIIFEESCSEDIQKHATVRSSVLEVLVEMTKCCDLYLMETVIDDESEEKVLQALDNTGIFSSGSLVKDKVLFCSTENGRMSFVRQLEPDWHIDTSSAIVCSLARFIKCQLHITPSRPKHMTSNIFSSTSLEQFFGWSNGNRS